ncbi:hypothetical protein BJAS_P4001 [Bathymodiolus japonicus methanotrophic gill symbiont]|nr:hypothetical protein BJAS_P4001 [Bathymodiolus japonicus methanotrophic gill symbiont]
MAKHEGKHPDAIPKYECVLVLGGDQGLHKTSFIKYLLPAELHKYIKDSVRLDTKDRDSMLNILRCWIPELAGLDPALKKKGRGVAIFAKACFGHPSPSKQQKLNATTYASGGPDSSSSPRPDPTRGRNIGSK